MIFLCENTINIAFLGNGIFTEIFITCGELVLEYKGKNFSKEGAWKWKKKHTHKTKQKKKQYVKTEKSCYLIYDSTLIEVGMA